MLRWLGWQAGQRDWPVAGLLLASAGLFLAPILPLLLFGPWRAIGQVCLLCSAPFLVSYVVATYRLRRQLGAPQPVAA